MGLLPICGTVSQISPPIRIVLVCAIAFMAAWMLFLRPKTPASTPSATPAATAPGVKGLGSAVDKANAAAATQEASDAAVQDATGGQPATKAPATSSVTAAKGAAASAAKGDSSAGNLPLPILKAVAKQKVLVLLFWNPKSADDRMVHRAVAKVDRWGGDVFVRSANIKSISKYGRITRGADVEQSPTVVVVDRKLKAESLVGYVDTQSIDQAVVDALRASGSLIKAPYLRKVNDLCGRTGSISLAVADPNNAAQVPAYMAGQRRVIGRLSTRFAAIKAPARFRSFKRATAADLRAYSGLIADWATYLGPNPSAARVGSSLQRFGSRTDALSKRTNRRMDAKHVLACGSNG